MPTSNSCSLTSALASNQEPCFRKLSRHRECFAKVYTASLYAGEKSGNLEEVIRRYIEYQRIIDATKSKVKSAITYPIILTVLLVVLVTYLMAVVVPQFATFYEGLNAQLPQVTLTLIAISRSIRQHLVTAVLLILGGSYWFADLESNRERRVCSRWNQAAAADHWRPLEQVRVFAAEPHALHAAVGRNSTGQCARDCGRLVREPTGDSCRQKRHHFSPRRTVALKELRVEFGRA